MKYIDFLNIPSKTLLTVVFPLLQNTINVLKTVKFYLLSRAVSKLCGSIQYFAVVEFIYSKNML